MLAKAKLRLGRREIDGTRSRARQDGVRLVEKTELGEPPHPPGGGITARQARLGALLLQQSSGPRNIVNQPRIGWGNRRRGRRNTRGRQQASDGSKPNSRAAPEKVW
jgi:hypothetical protein